MKHRIKMWLREAYARLLFHTPLGRLVDRVMPRRLTILAGHCVVDSAVNGDLPADMKISSLHLERILGWLARRYDCCTMGEGVVRLRAGGGRSMVALTMDDGYRDNKTALLPLLERVGAKATVFLESRPLDERRVNWSHKYFWLLGQVRADELVREYASTCGDGGTAEKLRAALARGGDLAYEAKRVLKYDAPREDRERTVETLFRSRGGDERGLCERIYMTWDDARELQGRGVELGGHTRNHFILSRLGPEEAHEEVARGRDSLERELGEDALRAFAYPFGRRWDFDDASVEAVRAAGFEAAVTTHAGTNCARSDPYRLARWMIDEETPLHLLAAEACGGFELLRRVGLDLSE